MGPPPATRESRSPRVRGFRRLTGLDRSGPLPRQTRAGQPLRPLTIPNLVGYARLLSIPVFLYLAFESDDGRSAAATLLYFWITFGDYVDGFLARATGQYSRLGALMDPLIDRLAALAGAAVCWHFELLPRWSIVALVVRELATLALDREDRDVPGVRRALLDAGLRHLDHRRRVHRRRGRVHLRDPPLRTRGPASGRFHARLKLYLTFSDPAYNPDWLP
jgi:hypothetical protein